MREFPAFLSLRGRNCLIVGREASEVSRRKAAPLIACGAAVTFAETFAPSMLDGMALAIGAEGPDATLRALFDAASARGIPVNCVDRPEFCTFITPAIVDRDPLTIAISSSGTAPVLARLLRARIETLVAPGWGRLAALAERFKTATREALPDVLRRRRMLEAALGGQVAALVFAGDEAGAETAYRAALASARDGLAVAERGIVHFVGAGPGEADLLTLRALRLLGEADVIVHDRLVGPGVLEASRRDAERIFVGKTGAAHSVPQEAIGALLVRLGGEGRKVVRLKGGDPSIFAHLNEEVAALRAAGIAFSVVPGVTAASACAASAGLSLSDREQARSVTLVTARTVGGRIDLDFAALARLGGTIAIYMGRAVLPALAEGFQAVGVAPGTGLVVVSHGGGPDATIWRGPLGGLAEASAEGPAVVLLMLGASGPPRGG